MTEYSIFADTMVDLTYVQVEEAVRRGDLVLVPIGVIEEHGPHLPLGTDIYAAFQLCRLVRKELALAGVRSLIAPPFYWGVNQVTSAFTGSFQIRPNTAKALLTDIIDSLLEQGFRELFLINHHGDQLHNEVVLDVVREHHERGNTSVRFIESDPMLTRLRVEPDDPAILHHPQPEKLAGLTPPSTLGVHAMGEETAVVAHWFPDLVDQEALAGLSPTDLTAEDLQKWRLGGTHARAVTPQGYFGDPHPHDPNLWRRYQWTAESMAHAVLVHRGVTHADGSVG